MKNRKRDLLVALAAAALLTVTAVGSATLAHDGAGGSRDPSSSPRPRPTLKAQPSRTPRADQTPRVDLKIDCSKVPPTVAPSASPSAATSAAVKDTAGFGRLDRDAAAIFARNWAALCSLSNVKSSLTGQLNGLIRQLQALNTSVARSSLSDRDKAILKAEIDAAIADVMAVKDEIGGATTVASAQAGSARVRALVKEVRAVRVQVQTILGSLRVLTSVARLEGQIDALQAKIDAAPSGIDTALAQRYLDDMRTRVAAAKAQAEPLRATLLAVTLDQIKSGAAYPTLAAAVKDLRMSIWDVWRAMQDGRIVTWILAGKPGFQARPTPSATPSTTPEPTATPTV
jgi:hypothetical protein